MDTILLLLIEFLTFALVVLVSMSVIGGAEGFLNIRRRLHGQPVAGMAAASPVMKSETIRNPFLRWVQSVTSLNDSKERAKLRRDLSQAGYDHPAAPVWYVVIRFSLAIGLPLGLVFSQSLAAKPLSGIGLIAATLLLCGLGLIGPRMFIDNRAAARRTQLEFEFPDALDLLVVCVEAGLGIEAAFVRVGQEVGESHPRVAEEFGRLAQELSAGRGRAEALRAMADRADVDTLRSFVALAIQTDALGVSIGQTLRTYSAEMRERRLLKAEEKAMRIPVLISLPLVVCILPVIVVSLLLPGAIDMMRTLGPALYGH